MKYRTIFSGMLCVSLAAAVGCTGIHRAPIRGAIQPGPGVDGPGPGVHIFGGGGIPAPTGSSQILFHGPEGMEVAWDVVESGMFDSDPLVLPGRSNFARGALFRLKLTNIPGREGLELFPTLEVGRATARSEAFLAHNAVPVQFTEEDFEQVRAGNFVTKVIYLPDAEFQELALAGVETLVSTRLEPGVDPIEEADRRGAILAIVRLGNKDLQIPGSEETGMMQAGFSAGCADGNCFGGGGAGNAGQYISGMTTPQYGVPITGTPIGLAGPPQLPLGPQAGLKRHVTRNIAVRPNLIPGHPRRKIHAAVASRPAGRQAGSNHQALFPSLRLFK